MHGKRERVFIIIRIDDVSYVFRQHDIRGPSHFVCGPDGRRGVRLLLVVELVVLVLHPIEFKEVDGQQDDAQEQHEADDQG